MSIIQGNSKTSAAGYNIDQSIRFNNDDSAYLSRTPASDGNLTTWTYSVWFKRSAIAGGTAYSLMSAGADNTNDTLFYFGPANEEGSLDIFFRESSATQGRITSYSVSKTGGRLFRDPSAWMHFVLVWDTTNATSADRIRLYINGERATTDEFAITEPSLNDESRWNTARANYISKLRDDSANYFDGYMAEINFIDGTALDASSFGETNADTGQWVPKAYNGSYGTNGFYITGANSADLGADDSGNGNDFTSSGLTADDQVLDTPSNNFATLNPLWKGNNTTLSEGNLKANQVADDQVGGTFYFDVEDTNYYYAEFVFSSSPNSSSGVGLIKADTSMDVSGGNANTYWYFASGNKRNVSGVSYGSSYTTGDVIGVAVGNGSVTFYKNNVSQGVAFTGLSGSFTIGCAEFNSTSGSMHMNFGQDSSFAGTKTAQGNTDENGRGDFYYTPPSGYLALCTANLPDPTIADPSAYFQTTLYTGNGSTQEVNQSGNSTFEPGLVWIKTRSNAASHALFDQVRGVNKQLRSDSNGAEYTAYSDLLTAFDADGFTLGADATVNNVNVNTYTYAAWQWAADGTSGSSNTDGSITSTVSANTTSGFSAGIYTGNATNNATVGHGLGIAPKIVFVKRRAITGNWRVYSEAVNQVLYLDLTNAGVSPTEIKSTSSTVFTLGSSNGVNGSGDTHVFYAWAEVEGFSKFGSFTGNGSTTDGPFIYTGFTPEFFMWKRTNSATYGDWTMMDTKRDPFNMAERNMRANSTIADDTGEANLDFVSNGIKHRGGTSARFNQSGATYIYMAFASSPFKTATAR